MDAKQRNTSIVGACTILLLFAAMATSNSSEFFSIHGIWSILPPLVAICLAFTTKNVVISLFVGVLTGTFLLSIDGFNVFSSVGNSFILSTEYMLGSLADKWNAGIILQVLTIGGLIALITKLGGARAIAEKLSKHAKGPVSVQVITWLMGLIIFFDDYANSLIVGPIMRPVMDKNKISREKLSFIIDATAAPVAGLALISTWIGAEISYIQEGLTLAGITDISAYNLFVASIPYRFYNILMLAFVFFSALMLREFGPMLKAERNARNGIASKTNKTLDSASAMLDQGTGNSNIWNAIIPLSVLIISCFLGFYFNGRATIIEGGDPVLMGYLSNPFSFAAIRECFGASDASIVLFQSALLASIVALLMGVFGKKFSMEDGINVWVTGVKSLIITCIILVLAWTLSSTIKELGTATFLVNALSDSVPVFILPAIIFILASIISFATGTSYGTMAILLPLAIPFAVALAPNDYNYLVICTSAVLSGAIFGDHCSPISDTTILSSMGADCDHLEHVNTQIWYAIVVAGISVVFGYLPLGLGVPIYIVLPASVLVIAGTLFFFGKKVEKA